MSQRIAMNSRIELIPVAVIVRHYRRNGFVGSRSALMNQAITDYSRILLKATDARAVDETEAFQILQDSGYQMSEDMIADAVRSISSSVQQEVLGEFTEEERKQMLKEMGE